MTTPTPDARAASRVRLTDRRLLILFLVLVALLAVCGTYVKQTSDALGDFRRASNVSCEANRRNTVAFNDFIGRLQSTTVASTLITAREKRQRVDFYQGAKQPIPSCPAPPPGRRPRLPLQPPPPAPTVPGG